MEREQRQELKPELRAGSEADRFRIGLMGMTPGAGTSLLTVCLAGYFAEKRDLLPAVAELGGGGLYDSLGMDRHFVLKEFHSYYKACSGSVSLRRLSNVENGVNWALKTPKERECRLEYREALRLIYGLSGDVLLFDFSGRRDEELWLLLKEMDLVLAVIDPLPNRLLCGQGTLERWKLSGMQLRYLINKDNEGVDRRELLRFLKLRKVDYLPFLAPELLYGAQYDGRSPWDCAGVRGATGPVFDAILRTIEFGRERRG